MAAERPDAEQHRDRPAAAEPLDEPVEQLEIEDRLGHRELRAGLDLPPEAVELELEVVGGRVDGDADEELGRGVEALADVVLAAVQPARSWTRPIESTS